jgi:predicted transcriptional regulator of viral defense system
LCGVPGANYNALMEIAVDQYGYVTTEEAAAVGVVADRLRTMAKRGLLKRIAYGLYRVDAVPMVGLEEYMEATLWPRGGGVLSHDTALDLHDVCHINPAKIHVTIREDLRITRKVPSLFVLHHRVLDARDLTYHEGIPVVTAARAIRDCIETYVGTHLIAQAIPNARARGMITKAQEAELNRLVGLDRYLTT